MSNKMLAALTAVGSLLAMSAPGASAAISANYLNAATSGFDEGGVAAFNIYDLAVGAAVINPHAGNVGTISAPVVGDKFKGYFQSYVTAHQLNGVAQASPGLVVTGAGSSNFGYELTIFAEFEEEVTSTGPFSYTSAITSGTASLYFDTTPDYSFTADTGFKNDEVILTGTVTGGAVSLPLFLTGLATIEIAVTGQNSAIFNPDIFGADGIFSLDLRSSAVTGVSSVGGNAVAAGGLLLGADGNLELQPVPVPAAVWMLGSALVGMLSVSRRPRV